MTSILLETTSRKLFLPTATDMARKVHRAYSFLKKARMVSRSTPQKQEVYLLIPDLEKSVKYIGTVNPSTKKLTEIMKATGWNGEAKLLGDVNLRPPKKDAHRGKFFEEVFYKGVKQIKSGNFYFLLSALDNESVLLILETENLIHYIDKASHNRDVLETMFERLIELYDRFHERTVATIMLSAIIHGIVWKTKTELPVLKIKQ